MAMHLYNPPPPKKEAKKVKKVKEVKKVKKAVGGFNLTPLISALLLAGIKLSLEQNKKITDDRKSSKPKRRPRTM